MSASDHSGHPKGTHPLSLSGVKRTLLLTQSGHLDARHRYPMVRCNKHKRCIFIASGDTWSGRYLRLVFSLSYRRRKKAKLGKLSQDRAGFRY
jgi:hypothetical protein